jgi:hypothetical protein
MNKWLQLSEGTYLFGQGGVNRIEPMDKRTGIKTPYNTVLYSDNTRITVVKETEKQIYELLLDINSRKE